MEQPSPIEVTFRLTQQDLHKVYFHTFLRLWLLIPLVLCMIAIVILSAWMDRTCHTSYLIPILRFVTVAAALVVISFALPYLLARNTMRTSAAFKGDLRYTFDASGVNAVTPASQSHMNWSGFHRAVELKDFFLLYMSSRVFHIVPKRVFSNPDQLDAFRSLLLSTLGAKTRLRK
jgi:hypothetical protein